MNIAIAAGGTGGHIFPAIAIIKELTALNNDIEPFFIGSKNGIENKIVPEHNIPFLTISVQKIYRYFTFKHLLFPYFFIESLRQSLVIIKQYNIQAVIGCGGYVCGPIGLMAHYCNVPLFLQEQNSFPGLTIRKLSTYAQKIYLGNKSAEQYLPQEKTVYTGNPIRNFPKVSKEQAIKFWQFDVNKKVIFVYGGSQGASAVNQTVLQIIPELTNDNVQIIFQTGALEHNQIKQNLESYSNVIVKDFIQDMHYAYTSADLVICRAGAISLAEINHFGLPSIIIPLPHSAGDHQQKNAESLVNYGAAEMILQNDLSSTTLLTKIRELFSDDTKLNRLSECSKILAKENSAEIIAKDILMNLSNS